MESLEEFYLSVCTELQLSPNTYIIHMLKETENGDSKSSLQLKGNSQVKPVCRITNNDMQALSKALWNNLTVTALYLGYNLISDEGAVYLAELFQKNKTLQEIDLMCNNLEVDGAEQIANSLHHNVTLKKLKMTGNKIENKGGLHFANMLKINTTLEHLDLSDCDLGMQSLIAITVVLKDNKSICSINVSRPLVFSLQEEATVHMAQMLTVNQTLRELHMAKHGMTDTGVRRLCEALMLNHTLIYLDLRCNKITRDGAKCLARVLKQNDSLQILDLSFNRLEDEGAMNLSEALALSHCKLRALAIQKNNIASNGLIFLANSLTTNCYLTHVYMWGNNLEEAVRAHFSQLIASGRLSTKHTDVIPYEVDGKPYLAETSHGLNLHYYWTPSYGEPGNSARNAALALKTSKSQALDQCLKPATLVSNTPFNDDVNSANAS